MEGGDGAERNGAGAVAEEEEEDVEGDGDGEVEGDGGEEENPGGAPWLGMAPTESDDGRVLR